MPKLDLIRSARCIAKCSRFLRRPPQSPAARSRCPPRPDRRGVRARRARTISSACSPASMRCRLCRHADGTNLLAGYKRAANILKKEDLRTRLRSCRAKSRHCARHLDFARCERRWFEPEPAEAALIAALDVAAPAARPRSRRRTSPAPWPRSRTLRAPIDAFFDSVTVNDADPQKRAARLALLARFRDAVHGVADFSKIEG